jgi:hypothetical protein
MVISLIIRCGKENKIKLTIEVKNQKVRNMGFEEGYLIGN